MATAADASASGAGGESKPAPRTPLPAPKLDFNDPTTAFASKSLWEVIRAVIVFEICAIGPVVRHSDQLERWARLFLGDAIHGWLLKRTFFGHFCAGETSDDIMPTIKKLEAAGVRSILDYAAEADVGEDGGGGSGGGGDGYDAAERLCDLNADILLQAIEAAGKQKYGFAAVKLTGLGRPELLLYMSNMLHDVRRLFREFSAMPAAVAVRAAADDAALAEAVADPHALEAVVMTEAAHAPSRSLAGGRSPDVMVPSVDPAALASASDGSDDEGNVYAASVIDFDTFCKAVERLGIKPAGTGPEGLRASFDAFDHYNNGFIDYLEWVDALDPLTLGQEAAEMWVKDKALSAEQRDQVDRMFKRLDRLVERADALGVTLMVDAEYTYIQPAIDHICLHLQRKYNRGRYPIVYNTYQCYLKDCLSRLRLDLRRAEREGFWFGGKLVRGAYMVTERARAKKLGYKDPVHDRIEDTHRAYHAAIDDILARIDRAEVLVASHNEDSIKYTAERMAAKGIKADDGGVFFGQLLGMCDHVTFTLGAQGYSAYKYVPYGPWHEVVPYLLRRAVENSAMLGSAGASKERRMWRSELLRRLRLKR